MYDKALVDVGIGMAKALDVVRQVFFVFVHTQFDGRGKSKIIV